MNSRWVGLRDLSVVAAGLAAGVWFASAAADGTDAFGYTWTDGVFTPEDISGSGTPLPLGDDETSQLIDLGFEFDFYGAPYDQLVVNANGFVSFDPAITGTTYQPAALPNPADGIRSQIAGFWEDLNVPPGNIRTQTLGAAGARRFVVGYYDVPHFGGGPLTNFEIVLHEATNHIGLQYLDAPDDNDGNPTSVGLENADGTTGLPIAFAEFGRTNSAYTITHPGFEAVDWAVDGGGSWNSTPIWSTGTLPGVLSDVTITRAVPVTVTGPTSATTIHRLAVGGADFNTLELGSSSLTVSDRVDVQAGGVVRLAGGDLTTRSLTVAPAGELELRDGDLVIYGGTLSWQRDFDFPATYDGVYGATESDLPRLILRDGATGVIDHAPESINFSQIRIGDNTGGGSLQLLEGSVLEVAGSSGIRVQGFTEVGQPANIPSTLVVDGLGSVLTLSRTDGLIPSLDIGGDLSQLSVTNGGVIESAGGLRLSNGALGVVSGTDTRIVTTDRTTLIRHEGNREQGTSLTINGGAEVLINVDGRHDISATSLSFSPFSATTTVTVGEANVSGDPSRLYFSGDLDLRAFQSDDIATIDILDGGILEVAGTTSINNAAGQIGNDFGAARILVNGGTFRTQSIRADLSQSPVAGLFLNQGKVEVWGGGGMELGSAGVSDFMVLGESRTLEVDATLRVRDGQLFVLSGGLLNTGNITFDATSTFILSGGTIETGSLHRADGFLDFPAGLLDVQGGAITGFDNQDFTLGYNASGGTAELRLSEGATFELAGPSPGGLDLQMEDARLSVFDGSFAGVDDLIVAYSPGSNADVILTGTDDADNPATLRAASQVTIGGRRFVPGGDGRIEIGPGGLLDVEQGLLKIWDHGSNELVLNGGELRADSLDIQGNPSRFNWITGRFFYENDLLVASNGDLGPSIVLGPGMDFHVTDHTEVRDTGSLSINGGSFRTSDLIVQPGAGFSFDGGELTIDGGTLTSPGTELVVDGTGGGDGSLRPRLVLTNGAAVNRQTVILGQDALGTLHVNGIDGQGGRTTLTAGALVLGSSLQSFGDATIDGGAFLDNSQGVTIVGDQGIGILDLKAMSTAESAFVVVGQQSGSLGSLRVRGGGAQWTTSGATYIGQAGAGNLLIDGGGQVDAEDFFVAQYIGSTGTVRVEGADSETISRLNVDGSFELGGIGAAGGVGRLEILANGIVDVTGTLIAHESEGTAIQLGGGELRAEALDLRSGSTQITDGWSTGRLAITGPQGLLIGDLGLLGNTLSLTAGQELEVVQNLYVDNAGSLTIGPGAGVTATLALVDDEAGGQAVLAVRGDATGGGTLDAQLLVGVSGSGKLELTGGQTNAEGLFVGVAPGSDGVVEVGSGQFFAGPTAELNVGTAGFEVGGSGQAQLDVLARGRVAAAGDVTVSQFGGVGEVRIRGLDSRFNVAGDLILNGPGASLRMEPSPLPNVIDSVGGSLVVAGTLRALPGAQVDLGVGTLEVGMLELDPNALAWSGGTLRVTEEQVVVEPGSDLGGAIVFDEVQTLDAAWTGPTAAGLVIGDTLPGTFDVPNGRVVVADDLVLARSAGSGGSRLVLSGAELVRPTLIVPSSNRLAVGGSAFVGLGDDGELRFDAEAVGLVGGAVEVAAGPGSSGSQLTLQDAGTRLEIGQDLVVGAADTGFGTISAGAQVTVGQGIVVSQTVDAGGSVLDVFGTGTRATADTLRVAPSQGYGTLSVRNGGQVVLVGAASVGGEAGLGGGGMIEVHGEDALLDVGGGLTIAPSGAGSEASELRIDASGQAVVAGQLDVRATGEVDLIDGTLRVGSLSAPGRLNWSVGLLDITADGLDLGSDLGGSFDVDTGKTLRVAQELSVVGPVPAVLTVSGGGLVESGSGTVGDGPTGVGRGVEITGTGSTWRLDDSLVYRGSSSGGDFIRVSDGGALQVGQSLSLLDSGFKIDGGTLLTNRIEVGANAAPPTGFDPTAPLAVTISGGASTSLSGSLWIGLDDGVPGQEKRDGQLEVTRQGSNQGLVKSEELYLLRDSVVDVDRGRIEVAGILQLRGRLDVGAFSQVETTDLELRLNDEYALARVAGLGARFDVSDTTTIGVDPDDIASVLVSASGAYNSGATTFIGSQSNARGQLTLDGVGSTWLASGDVHVGGVTGDPSTGLVGIGGGTATIDGTLHVYDTGDTRVRLLGGKLKAGSIDTHGNSTRFDWLGGELELDTFVVGTSGPLGPNVLVDNLRPGLTILGDTVVATDGVLTLQSGATFTTGGLDTSGVPANFVWDGGTLDLTAADLSVGAAGPLGDLVDLSPGKTLNLRADGVVAVDATGTLSVSGGTLRTGSLDLGDTPTRLNWSAGRLELTDSGLTVGPLGTLGAGLLLPVGGQLDLSGPLTVGESGTGTVSVANGSSMVSAAGAIGVGPSGSTSSVAVGAVGGVAPASWQMPGDLSVGGDGATAGHSGVLVVSEGGSVGVGGTLKIHDTSGQVLLAAGVLNVGTLDTDSNPTRMSWTGGHLGINQSDLTIGANGALGDSLAFDTTRTLDVAQTLRIGDAAPGTLAINAGGRITGNQAAIGGPTGSGGSMVTVEGNGARWDLSSDLSVGFFAVDPAQAAQLEVGGGGVVHSSFGSLRIGRGGSVLVRDGGQVFSDGLVLTDGHVLSITNGLIEVEQGSTSFNTLVLDGGTGGDVGTLRLKATSSLGGNSANQVVVGSTGHARLELQTTPFRAARLNSFGTAILGQDAGATGEAVVSGRLNSVQTWWAHSGDLTVGLNGTGDLRVNSQARLTTQDAFIAATPGSVGAVTIDQGGQALSTWQAQGSVYVGGTDLGASGGTASLNVGSRALLDVSNDLMIYANAAGSPQVTLGDGGTIETGRILTDGRPAGFAFNGGTLRLMSTGVDLSPTGELGPALTLETNMTLDTAAGGEVVLDPAGTLTLNENAVLRTRRLDASNAPANLTWNGGTIELTATDLNVGPGGDLGSTVSLTPPRQLRLTGGDVNLADGGQLAISGGELVTRALTTGLTPARLDWTSGTITLTNQSLAIDPAGELGVLNLSEGRRLNVSQDVVLSGAIDALNIGDGGSLDVDGTSYLESSDAADVTAFVTADGAAASWSTGSLNLRGDGGHARLEIVSTGTEAATVASSSGTLYVAPQPGGSASVLIDGSAASLSVSAGAVIGRTSPGIGGQGLVEVINGGRFSTGSGITVVDGTGSRLILNGGTVSAASLNTSGNLTSFEWIEGDLQLGSLSIGNGSALGSGVTLDNDHRLAVSGTTTVAAGARLHLREGEFATGRLDLNTDESALEWSGGRLVLTANATSSIDRAGALGEAWQIDGGRELLATGLHQVHVGATQVGSLTLLDDALTEAHRLTVANQSGANGALTVSGTNARLVTRSTTTPDLIVGNSGLGQLIIDAGGTVDSVNSRLGVNVGGQGTATLTGATSQWRVSRNMVIGERGDATLRVRQAAALDVNQALTVGQDTTSAQLVVETGGTADVGSLSLGAGEGSRATATVTGAGSRLTASQSVNVGIGGNGQLDVSSGARLDALALNLGTGTSGSGGVVFEQSTGTIAGTVRVAERGNANLDVALGSMVGVGGELVIGQSAFSDGQLRVAGPGSSLNVSGFTTVGELGTGTLLVEQGGLITSAGARLGVGELARITGNQVETDITVDYGIGSARIDGTGSRWLVDGTLELGAGGPATATVENGGRLDVVDLWIGTPSVLVTDLTTLVNAEPARLDVTGPGSRVTAERLAIGGNDLIGGGQADITVSNGADLIVAQEMRVYDGSLLNIVGGHVQAGQIVFETPAALGLQSGRLSALQITGDLVQTGGTLAPGNSPGLTVIDGGYVNAGGVIEIELGGRERGTEYDAIDVTGNLVLGGTLDLSTFGGFLPDAGDSFTILETSAALSGTFSNVVGADLGAGRTAYVLYEAQRIVLAIMSSGLLEGDYNSDGFVSQGDLDLVLLNWGDASLPSGFDPATIPGGGPFDGLISQNELDGVLLNWGDGTPPSAFAIPEPSAVTLMALGVFGLLRRQTTPRLVPRPMLIQDCSSGVEEAGGAYLT